MRIVNDILINVHGDFKSIRCKTFLSLKLLKDIDLEKTSIKELFDENLVEFSFDLNKGNIEITDDLKYSIVNESLNDLINKNLLYTKDKFNLKIDNYNTDLSIDVNVIKSKNSLIATERNLTDIDGIIPIDIIYSLDSIGKVSVGFHSNGEVKWFDNNTINLNECLSENDIKKYLKRPLQQFGSAISYYTMTLLDLLK